MRTLIATPKAPILVATFATSFSIISLFTGCGASSFNPTPSKTTPTITWNTPNVVPVGTVLSSTQLDATANAPGTFVYSPAPNVILSTAGTTKLSVTFTPMDTVNYTTATATVSITVDPAVLTVTAASASRAYGAANPTFIDSISGYVNGDTFSVVSGTATLTTTASTTSVAGTYPITAAIGTLAASNYSFTFVPGTLTITATDASLTWNTPAAITYGTPLSGAQLNATSTVAGPTPTHRPWERYLGQAHKRCR